MSKASGAVNALSSRLAEMCQNTTLSPSLMAWPPSSVSATAVRRKCMTGVTKRSISSTALGSRLRSWRSFCHCSGWSKKAAMAPDIKFWVVSLPATMSNMKKRSSSSSFSFSPSTSESIRTETRSSLGASFRLLASSSA